MSRVRTILAVTLFALTVTPAIAADWRMTGPSVIYASPGVAAPYVGKEPYFLVNQGPEYSGPRITITELTWTDTDMHTSFPFIGMSYGMPNPGLSALGAVPEPVRVKPGIRPKVKKAHPHSRAAHRVERRAARSQGVARMPDPGRLNWIRL